MTLKELRKSTGLEIQLIWCANTRCCKLRTKRPHSKWDRYYIARLHYSQRYYDKNGYGWKHVILVGPRGGIRSPETHGWTMQEAKERLIRILRGKKIVSIRSDSGWQDTVVRIPKTLAA